MFSYPLRTALAVGLSMAQIGEFAFVLLSVASHQGLLAYQVYMLLMGACWPMLRPQSRTFHALCFAEGQPPGAAGKPGKYAAHGCALDSCANNAHNVPVNNSLHCP